MKCGWDNLEETVKHERKQALKQLLDLPEEDRTDEIRQWISGLQDLSIEERLIASLRKP